MYARTSKRGRRPLVLIVVLVLVAFLFGRGGANLVSDSRQMAQVILAPFHRAAYSAGAPFRSASAYSVRLSRVTARNQTLENENAAYKSEIEALRRYRGENIRLRKLAALSARTELPTKAGHVISRSPTSWQSLATIDIGSLKGVKRRSAVLNAGGLIGQVAEVSAGTAVVRLLDDRRSGVAVEVVGTGVTGVVEGRMNGELRLRFIAGDARIRKGDKLVTSGAGGVYPRGLPVGMVASAGKSAYSLEKQITIKPSVNYRTIEEVLVVIDTQGSSAK